MSVSIQAADAFARAGARSEVCRRTNISFTSLLQACRYTGAHRASLWSATLKEARVVTATATFAGTHMPTAESVRPANERTSTKSAWSGGPAVIEHKLLRPVTLRPRVSDGYAFFRAGVSQNETLTITTGPEDAALPRDFKSGSTSTRIRE